MTVVPGETQCEEAQPAANGSSSPVLLQPFRRPRTDSRSRLDSGSNNTTLSEDCARKSILRTLKSLGVEVDESTSFEGIIDSGGIEKLADFWRKRDSSSEIAFQGLLSVLEYCLQHSFDTNEFFEKFVNALGYHTVQFWRAGVPYVFDSDMSHGTKYRDALLFSLTLYDVNTGKSRLK